MDMKMQDLLKEHPSLEAILDGKKIKCRLSGHEMPVTALAVETYVNGKKYKKLRAEQDLNVRLYQTHLLPSKKTKNQLQCTLTARLINNLPDHIQRHVQGRKFKRALARWEECQKTGEVFKVHTQPQTVSLPADSDPEINSAEDDSEISDDAADSTDAADSMDGSHKEEEGSDFDFDEMLDLTMADHKPEQEGIQNGDGKQMTNKRKKPAVDDDQNQKKKLMKTKSK